MGHDDAVYLAKLAEQAERYEGTSRLAVGLRWMNADALFA